MTSRYAWWFQNGQRDAERGEWLSFDDAPARWTEEEVEEAETAYKAGWDSKEIR